MDGAGWWMEKISRLQSFYGWSEDFVLRRQTGAKNWCYYNWARLNEASVFGNSEMPSGKYYIAQEIDKILKRKTIK